MSNGGKFELGVALKGKLSLSLSSSSGIDLKAVSCKRMCVTTHKGSSYKGIVEKINDCAHHGATLLLVDGTMHRLFRFSDIKEIKEDTAVEVELEDPVENIGAKLVPAGNPMDNSGLR
ncbi:hypothetical protein YC2023_038695 [Brassica napus]